MRKIRETVVVNCPYGQAPGYLRYFFKQLTGQRGKAVITLEVPLSELHLPGDVVLSRRAFVTFADVPDSSHLHHTTAISWMPERGGPFPKFVGFLLIEADENYGMSRLALEGDYEPPFGAAGKVFDAAVGRTIARVTARHLLDTLRDSLEKWQRDLYAKPTIPA